jgi:hypothetical protein
MRAIDINGPDHTLVLKNLNDPSEIHDYFKKHGIKKYTYGIKCHDITVKYGLSGKHGGRMIPGERVRGQAAQLDGWIINGDDRKVGRDLRPVLESLNVTNKNLFQIEIWDMTNEPNSTFDPDYNIKYAESELLKQFEQEYKRRPIGNPREEKRLAAVSRDQFHSLFD